MLDSYIVPVLLKDLFVIITCTSPLLLTITIVIGIIVTLVQNAMNIKMWRNIFRNEIGRKKSEKLAMVLICDSMVEGEILG